MRKKLVIFLATLLLMFFTQKANAQTGGGGPCYCEQVDPGTRRAIANCSPAGILNNCTSDSTHTCTLLQDAATCDQRVRQFNAPAQGNNVATPNTNNNGGLVSKIIRRPCVLADNFDPATECGDVTIFLYLMFDIINYLFSIIGGVALLFFVYGGFVFILSEGNAEKVAHGKSIIVASVLGIIIAFSGYALVRFVGTVIGLKSEYQLIE